MLKDSGVLLLLFDGKEQKEHMLSPFLEDMCKRLLVVLLSIP